MWLMLFQEDRIDVLSEIERQSIKRFQLLFPRIHFRGSSDTSCSFSPPRSLGPRPFVMRVFTRRDIRENPEHSNSAQVLPRRR